MDMVEMDPIKDENHPPAPDEEEEEEEDEEGDGFSGSSTRVSSNINFFRAEEEERIG